MKTCIQTLSIMAIAASLSFGQDAPKGPKEGKRPNPEKIFAKIDANSDGNVDLAEFKETPRAKKNEAKAGEVFKKIDTDNSGGISLGEFKAHQPKPPGNGGKGKKKGGGAPAGAE